MSMRRFSPSFLWFLVLGCGRSPLLVVPDDSGGETGTVADGAPGDAGASPDGPSGLDARSPSDPLTELAGLCLLASSCGAAMSPPQSVVAGDCTVTVAAAQGDDPVAARFLSCESAHTCKDLLACLGNSLLLTEACSSSTECDGTSIVGGGGWTYDCARVGLVCAQEDVGGHHACCAVAACDAGPSTTCVSGGVDQCLDGLVTHRPCAGGSCDAGQCVGSGAPCNAAQTQPSCSGTVRTSCVGGRLAASDCASQPVNSACSGGSCVPAPGGGAPCLVPNATQPCAGTSAVVCTMGGERTVDCTSLGFSRCVVVSGQAVCE
jgi:hypothetical protein